jgi:hypothetical protein
VRATGFTTDEDRVITDLTNARIIKRPENGAWQLSGSSNVLPPVSLDSVSITGITGFSDFGIGLNCNRLVTTGLDGGPGSLRYILEHCAVPGDTIKFAANVDLVFVVTDTLILDQDVCLFDNTEGRVVIRSDGIHSVFTIREGVIAQLKQLDVETGPGMEGRAASIAGTLILEDVIIRDDQSGGSTIYNQGVLDIRGSTEIRNE